MAPSLGVFLSELKRRKVYRVAVAYIVVGLGVLGAAEVIMDPLGLEGARPFIVIFTLLGFPLALILAWAYEVRPEQPRAVEPPGEEAGSEAGSKAGSNVETVTRAEPATAAQPRSIAVLAFANMSSDPENEYFCDGISEEIINALAHLPELKVAGRTSAFSFKGTDLDVPEIGTRLNVATVLEGSVRKMGNQLRITAQLIDVGSGYHLWSEQFDRQLDDIFAIQNEIATNIAERLEVTMGGAAPEPRVQTDNFGAYDFYLKGRALLYQRGMAMFQARECFEDALALDTQYALAHAGLADSYSILGYYGLIEPAEAWPRARQAAEHAVALAPELAEAHNALAIIAFVRDWNWATAGREFQRSLELNPSYVQARCWYAMAYLQGTREEHEAAIAEARVAVDIDPLSPYAHTMLGYVLTSAGQTEEAVEEARRGAESDPDSYWGQFVLATAYHFAARLSEAEGAYQRALSASKRHPLALANLGRLYAEWEKPGDAKAVDAELVARSRQEYVQPITLSLAAACAGRAEEALGLLQRACEERDPWLAWGALTSPWFEPLRAFPEYEDILTRMKLPLTGSDS
ncbi:MAG: hypothetical protein IIB37_08130 [Gemmatimonadetes bacterium]|nr:hypothetical protein [Gemmatimonadota bacterium]